jgi:WD40 repeat protein
MDDLATLDSWIDAGLQVSDLEVAGKRDRSVFAKPGNSPLSPDYRKRTRPAFPSPENGREALRLRGYTNLDGALAFSPDGRRLASAWRNGTLIKLWDLSTGREVLSLLRESGDPVADAGCRFDGNRLVLLGVSGNFKVWNATPLPELGFR